MAYTRSRGFNMTISPIAGEIPALSDMRGEYTIGWNVQDNLFYAKVAINGVATVVQINEKNPAKTVVKTIGGVGVAGCDSNFTSAANTTAQPIDLGSIIPARARIRDCFTYTEAAFTGATSMGITVGTATGGNQVLTTADSIAQDTIHSANLTTLNIAPIATAQHIWVGGTPGANWSGVTAGKLTIYITFFDVVGC